MLRKATADDLPALTALRCGAAKANPVDAAGWLQNVAGLENILVLEKNGQPAAMLAAVPVKYGQHHGVWLCGAAGVQGVPMDRLLAALETYFLENKVFYCNALAYNGQNSLQQYMFDYLRSIFEQNVRELNPDASAEETRKIGQFFAGAMMGILIPWVLSGMKSNTLSNMSELSIPVFNHEIMQKLLRGDPQ